MHLAATASSYGGAGGCRKTDSGLCHHRIYPMNLGLLFAMGIFFSLVYLRSGNLLLAGLVHGSWNAPLLGAQGDFLQLIIILGIIEIINRFLTSKKALQKEEQIESQD